MSHQLPYRPDSLYKNITSLYKNITSINADLHSTISSVALVASTQIILVWVTCLCINIDLKGDFVPVYLAGTISHQLLLTPQTLWVTLSLSTPELLVACLSLHHWHLSNAAPVEPQTLWVTPFRSIPHSDWSLQTPQMTYSCLSHRHHT